ncbi:uncharacterized protein MONBRDRAFT_12726 [Monosiga brevicollis MX1]|uniref:Uncharacterized protein n=1 Tax=Monosiga brevicollis TaxID=81824 RepID=A9VD49_MONBE|nr:uncharacterized protein MONBRDRAFT_12726 [Monosiga brevicollis MX1]EDQ84538.1 predicted protein [Monosiga brevicollis MX1]|eukprot:XP_001750654.1 hypothetical protein [Monosiga brevicollis MX1]
MATLDLEGCTAAGIQDIYGDISSDLDYLIYVNDILVDWILPCLRGDLASRFQREKSRQRIVLGAWFKQMGALFLQTTRHDITQASQALRDQRIRTADDFPVYRSSITAAVDTLRIEGAYSATLVIAQLVDGLPSKLKDVITNLYQPSWDLGKFFEVVQLHPRCLQLAAAWSAKPRAADGQEDDASAKQTQHGHAAVAGGGGAGGAGVEHALRWIRGRQSHAKGPVHNVLYFDPYGVGVRHFPIASLLRKLAVGRPRLYGLHRGTCLLWNL